MAFEVLSPLFPDGDHEMELHRAYRRVFGSVEGRKVLRHMLGELGFFDQVFDATEQERVLAVYGKRLLRLCGPYTNETIDGVVDALMNMPVIYPKKNDGV